MEICAIGIIKLKQNLEDSNFSWLFSFLVIKNLLNKTCFSVVNIANVD